MIAVTKYKTYDLVYSSHVTTTAEMVSVLSSDLDPEIICIDRMATYLQRQPDCTYIGMVNSGFRRLGCWHVEETMHATLTRLSLTDMHACVMEILGLKS